MSVLILKMPFSVIVLIMGYYIPPAIANIYFCIRIYRKYGMQKDNSFRKEDILYGKHVSIMSAVGTLANQLDNILVYHLLGPASLALYSFATIIPERIRTFLVLLQLSRSPK